MDNLHGVLFDLGGTLWASPEEDRDALVACYAAGRDALLACGCDASVEALIETVEGYLGEWEGVWKDAANHTTQEPTRVFVAEALKRLELAPTPEALEAFTDAVMEVSTGTAKVEPAEPDNVATLAALRERGLKLGVVSNAFMSAATIERIMEARGIARYVDYTVSSCEAGYRKPHPKIYEAALDALDLRPEETLFVGDRIDADVIGPAALGMGTVLTHQYKAEDPSTSPVKPDHVIKHLRELVGVVDGLLGAGTPP